MYSLGANDRLIHLLFVVLVVVFCSSLPTNQADEILLFLPLPGFFCFVVVERMTKLAVGGWEDFLERLLDGLAVCVVYNEQSPTQIVAHLEQFVEDQLLFLGNANGGGCFWVLSLLLLLG